MQRIGSKPAPDEEVSLTGSSCSSSTTTQDVLERQSPSGDNGKRSSRILVVEDSPTQAQELEFILEAAGYEVEVAPDGQRSLNLLNSADFDLVISDIVMPVLSGYELCRRIKDDPIKRDMPVILLTSLTDPMDIIHGLEAGADNFITKPYQPGYLLGRIRNILDNKALRPEGKLKIGTEVVFLGKKLTISSDKEQILDLLVSTFEDIVRTNRDLRAREAELADAKSQLDRYARRLEGQVRSTEDKYRRLMEQAQDAIFIMDTGGQVQEVNRRAEELLGQPAADIVGCSFEKWLPAAELDGHKAKFQKLLADGLVRLDNTRVNRRDGSQAHVDYSASLVEINGDRLVLAILHDVTETRKLEAQYRQAQKMEAVGQLAGGVAHDFNNLLTIISGYSEVLLQRLASDDPTRELITQIKGAGDRAATLTRQLLAFSRKQVLEPKVLDLNAVVKDTEKMLRRLIGEDMRLSAVLDETLRPVKADPGQIEQVIMNLVVNARDAMPQGGRITIETGNVDLDESYAKVRPEVKPGRYSMLALTDSGCGMDQATQARIFEPFFTTKGPGKGTGLGLATVYGIVKQSGGYIYVYSELGRGTTIKVYLPSIQGTVATDKPHSTRAAAMPKGTETILLVEDEDGVRALSRHILQTCGYTVVEACHGGQAVRICGQHQGPIHLLVSDVVMPHLGGRQLAEQVLALKPDMKVLFLSGYTDDAVVRHGILEAETPFLQKPFTPTALARKVREVLDRAH